MSEFIINKKEHIQQIINNFDFQKVYNVMCHLDWTWFDSEKTPTIERLKNNAFSLLKDISDYNGEYEDYYSLSSGSFKAARYEEHLELTFTVEEKESSILNCGDRYEKLKKNKERVSKISKISKNEDN